MAGRRQKSPGAWQLLPPARALTMFVNTPQRLPFSICVQETPVRSKTLLPILHSYGIPYHEYPSIPVRLISVSQQHRGDVFIVFATPALEASKRPKNVPDIPVAMPQQFGPPPPVSHFTSSTTFVLLTLTMVKKTRMPPCCPRAAMALQPNKNKTPNQALQPLLLLT